MKMIIKYIFPSIFSILSIGLPFDVKKTPLSHDLNKPRIHGMVSYVSQ